MKKKIRNQPESWPDFSYMKFFSRSNMNFQKQEVLLKYKQQVLYNQRQETQALGTPCSLCCNCRLPCRLLSLPASDLAMTQGKSIPGGKTKINLKFPNPQTRPRKHCYYICSVSRLPQLHSSVRDRHGFQRKGKGENTGLGMGRA